MVQAELLDSLPHTHPDARRNRRDLRIINALMGNHRWLAGMLAMHARRAESILEVGAGMGELALRLRARGWNVDGLDTWPRPNSWPAPDGWHEIDLRAFAGFDAYDVIYGNMIFHQFSAAELSDVGRRLRSHARLIIACEPARRRSSQHVFRLIAPLFGANHVSRHDGRVSIAAGFQRDELPRLLGLELGPWVWRCSTTAFGAYRMVAWRRAATGAKA